MNKAVPSEQLTFEAALAELEAIVRSLERGDTALEDSLAAYERGVALKTHCETKLREAQAKIEKISINKDGNVKIEPFEQEE
ncbi:MAG: exodeoxyribonuclease VII small subunit [Alphaproteobacteria bacterium CG_4_9_14_3_um_filter_47_13]|nr:MAG: exodeoxyribonuclease VII small subunit [Alphaproteobacteria bacterium CG_4_9_14_3_um_filter_47_13]